MYSFDLASTHHEVLSHLQAVCNTLIQSPDTKTTPYVYSYRMLGPHLLILYLLLPPTGSTTVRYLRYPLLATMAYLAVKTMRECRSAKVTIAYGIGLISAWSLLWAVTLLVFGDARSEFRRIERREGSGGQGRKSMDTLGGDRFASSSCVNEKRLLRARNEVTGLTDPSATLQASQSTSPPTTVPSSPNGPYYVWQTLPPTFLHRLDWVLDLFTNFRGIGWAHQNPTLPPPPEIILSTLQPKFPASNLPPSTPPTRESLLRKTAITLILHILALDTLKTLTLWDPYFLSLPAPPSASPFPFPTFTRLLLSATFTYTALSAIFLLAPFTACLLGPRILGSHADPWLYPPFFASPALIAQKGLAGLWGNVWHQLFRFAFDSAGDFLARPLGPAWGRKSPNGGLLRLVTAFILSGLLHASASYTMLPPTQPLHAFAFFAVQPIGILAHRGLSTLLRKSDWHERVPARLRGLGNVLGVVGWFYVTGPWIADDFAQGGIWLMEPVPVSLWRRKGGLWGGNWGGRWEGGKWWWERGFAF